ncbi:MAG: hypothetical protein ACMG57_04685 [Candidatus Dojkabacteria bacterium]
MITSSADNSMTNTSDYISEGKLQLISQRLQDLIKAREGQVRTLIQIAFKGRDEFLQRGFKLDNRQPMPESTILEISRFIEDILLTTPTLNEERSDALINDPVLNELISQAGENFQDERITKLLAIANSGEEIVPFEVAKAIYDYLFYKGHSSRGIYLSTFENKLTQVLMYNKVTDPHVQNMLDIFHNMTWQYGRID